MQTTPKLVMSAASMLLLAGCAQTVWVRPGTSQAEAQRVLQACDLQASDETSPSHLRVAHGHKVGAELANLLVNAVVEAVEQAGAKQRCMVAEGFHQETVQPAPATRYAAATPPPPAPDPVPAAPERDSVVPSPETVRPTVPRYTAANSPTPALNPARAAPPPATAIPEAPIPEAPIPEAPIPEAPVVAVRADPIGPATSIARRTLMTTDMMRLPDNSPSKRSFLLGACSAGDETACILTEIMPVTRPPQRPRLASARIASSGYRLVAD